MLAGYLPFDDDPANPEGDNINLLYKYIVTTPLTFPEYVTPHARDLLRRILVPDPRKRADLFEVARHSWLNEFSHIVAHITSSTTNISDIATTTVPAGKTFITLQRFFLVGLIFADFTLQKESGKARPWPAALLFGNHRRVSKATHRLSAVSLTSKEKLHQTSKRRRHPEKRSEERSRLNMSHLNHRPLAASRRPATPFPTHRGELLINLPRLRRARTSRYQMIHLRIPVEPM